MTLTTLVNKISIFSRFTRVSRPNGAIAEPTRKEHSLEEPLLPAGKKYISGY